MLASPRHIIIEGNKVWARENDDPLFPSKDEAEFHAKNFMKENKWVKGYRILEAPSQNGWWVFYREA